MCIITATVGVQGVINNAHDGAQDKCFGEASVWRMLIAYSVSICERVWTYICSNLLWNGSDEFESWMR